MSSVQHSLENSLQPPVEDSLQNPIKLAITEKFWGIPPNQTPAIPDAYWKFYAEECERALGDDGSNILVRTHQDIIDTVLSLNSGHLRQEIQDTLRQKLSRPHQNELELLDRAIDLSASLLLMVDVGEVPHVFSGRRRLEWTSGTLRECVALGFERRPSLEHKGIKLERTFSAPSLARFAGIKIEPTTNLLDHLRLTNDDTKLHVFHHASFLNHQLNGSLLPDGLAEETIRTLALLFPQTEARDRKWYRQLPSTFFLDPELMQCGHLTADDRQLENFEYWHDRLVVLKQVFDEASPKTISQWWYDRRNSVQWYTFWVAILVLVWTLITGLIQSIASIMQVYAAFNS
ncbi:hypothetical protein SVAN01_11267 [Stagonosporopsis vannaccii]|nr:hypothetical protein SVAN01_11267 [Stagonosporopsis vannaccii]